MHTRDTSSAHTEKREPTGLPYGVDRRPRPPGSTGWLETGTLRATCAWFGHPSYRRLFVRGLPLKRIRNKEGERYTHSACLADSALACWTTGISGSASFHRARSSL